MRYAAETQVPVEKSRAEIESILNRYGATAFSYASDSERGLATITFRAHSRFVRFNLHLPKRDEKRFRYNKRHQRRTDAATLTAWEQACRQRWRALVLAVKAKLEAVESGISTFEVEFLAHMILPDGQTAAEWMGPQIAYAYETGKMPRFLPGLPAPQPPPVEDDDDEIVQEG